MYENLSIVYDKLMDVDYNAYKNIISGELEEKNNLLILDLGCGSGAFLNELKKYGKVFAVDNSEEMLAIASQKASNINFFSMNLLDIENLNTRFDFILSAFDVFNYLENFEEFSKGLKAVYNCLENGGKFIFDLHTPFKVSTMLEKQVFAYDDEDISYIWFVYETENNLEMESDLTFFVKENTGYYKKIEQYNKQRTYYVEDILSEIKNIGFKINSYFCDFNVENKNYNESERIIFVLEK